MKRLSILALLVGALAFASASLADGGQGDGDHDGNHHHRGAAFVFNTTLTVPDHGCANNVWATDTIKRTYIVRKNDDGSYRLTAFDRGTFVTFAGVSPQGCTNVNNPHHGSTVTAGINGRFGGFLTENITGGTLNTQGTCAAVCDRAAFVSAFFGASAKENLDKNVKYLYVFMSKDPSLAYHVWLDRGKAGATGGLRTVDRGDIATS
jgi:hypothetical protein